MQKNKIFIIILSLLFCGLSSCASIQTVSLANSTYSKNFAKAQTYQNDGRYELARQYYLLALSSAQKNSEVQKVEQKLFAVERQIITLR